MPSQPVEGTSPLPTAPRLPPVESIVAAYLDNYSARRGDGSRVFPSDEPNLAVALVYLDIGSRLREPVCRAAARWEIKQATSALQMGEPEPTINIAGYLAAAARRDLGALDGEELIEHAIVAGADPNAARGVFGLAWRALFLATIGDARTDQELSERLRYLRNKSSALAAETDDQPLYQRSRLAFLLTLTADALEDDELRAESRLLAESVAAHQVRDGSIPHAFGEARAGAGPTAHLADFLLAASAAGLDDAAGAVKRYLLEERLDQEKRLLFAQSPGEVKYEFSPWVPLALARTGRRVKALATVLDPPAPEPPAFRIASVSSTPDLLRYEVEVGDRRATRTFDSADLNALVFQILDQLASGAEDELSPRLRSHIVLGLDSVLARADHEPTVERLTREIRESLDYVLSAQLPNGGWPFARKNIPSYIYTAGQRIEREFAEEEYTIDASVPGLALCAAHARFGDPRYLAAAELAFAFFEDTIGRVEKDGYTVWRLYPGDEKTARQGSAVNYELWAGAFFAALSAATGDDNIRERALSYIDDILDYTGHHLEENGDIAYGDYVSEKRTPYASWDAFLLFEIERFTELTRAGDMARRITHRLAEVMFPSGGIPNVIPFEQHLDEHRRWLVHRHGVGPYPMRGYYQLYCAAACAAGGVEPDAALRALGFVLIEMYEPVFSGMSTGYFGDGRYDDRPDSLERIGRDWLLLAMGNLHAVSEFGYQADLTALRPPLARLSSLLEQLASHAQDQWGWPPAEREAAAEFGRGCVAMHDLTGDENWLARARECSPRSVGGDAAARLAAAHLALDLSPERGRNAAALALDSIEPDVQPRVWASAAELAARVDNTPVAAGDALSHLAGGDLSDGLATAALARAAAAGSDEAATALRERLEGAWTVSVDAKLGRGYADPKTRALMRGDDLAGLSHGFIVGARVLGEPQLAARGLHLLRYLLHSYRAPTGELAATRKGIEVDPVTAGRMFHSLSRVAAETRTYADEQWAPAGMRRNQILD